MPSHHGSLRFGQLFSPDPGSYSLGMALGLSQLDAPPRFCSGGSEAGPQETPKEISWWWCHSSLKTAFSFPWRQQDRRGAPPASPWGLLWGSDFLLCLPYCIVFLFSSFSVLSLSSLITFNKFHFFFNYPEVIWIAHHLCFWWLGWKWNSEPEELSKIEHNSNHQVRKLDTNLIWNQIKYKCKVILEQCFSFVPVALQRSCRLFNSFLMAGLKYSPNLNRLRWERHTFLICLASFWHQFSAASHKGQATLKLLQITSGVQDLAKFWKVIYSQPNTFQQVEAQGSLSDRLYQEQMGLGGFQNTEAFGEQL